MSSYSGSVRRLLDSWPGKKHFGVYRFLPLFFLLGAGLEFSMINWTVGETNFCETSSPKWPLFGSNNKTSCRSHF